MASMENKADLDVSNDIISLVLPLVSYPDEIKVIRTDSEDKRLEKEQNYIVLCRKEDIGKLIGRHGVISDSIRTLLNVSIKNMRKRIHVKFMTEEEYSQSNTEQTTEE